jgi:anaerobic C4-dicarboxylate transporter
MIGLLAPHHIGLVQILLICVPSTLIAVFIASLVQLRVGKELKDDAEYQKRLLSGEVAQPGNSSRVASAPLKAGAMSSALIFLAGVGLVVLSGIFPELRTVPGAEKPVILSMPVAIAIVMATAAPWTFAFGLFFASVLLYSQAATARALMPLGLSLGIWPLLLIGMFPAVNGYFPYPQLRHHYRRDQL